jgi:hypothetical protein
MTTAGTAGQTRGNLTIRGRITPIGSAPRAGRLRLYVLYMSMLPYFGYSCLVPEGFAPVWPISCCDAQWNRLTVSQIDGAAAVFHALAEEAALIDANSLQTCSVCSIDSPRTGKQSIRGGQAS